MLVQRAEHRDVPDWLGGLAAEVDILFGGLLDRPDFYQALLRNIGRGSAWCVREDDGRPGARHRRLHR